MGLQTNMDESFLSDYDMLHTSDFYKMYESIKFKTDSMYVIDIFIS